MSNGKEERYVIAAQPGWFLLIMFEGAVERIPIIGWFITARVGITDSRGKVLDPHLNPAPIGPDGAEYGWTVEYPCGSVWDATGKSWPSADEWAAWCLAGGAS